MSHEHGDPIIDPLKFSKTHGDNWRDLMQTTADFANPIQDKATNYIKMGLVNEDEKTLREGRIILEGAVHANQYLAVLPEKCQEIHDILEKLKWPGATPDPTKNMMRELERGRLRDPEAFLHDACRSAITEVETSIQVNNGHDLLRDHFGHEAMAHIDTAQAELTRHRLEQDSGQSREMLENAANHIRQAMVLGEMTQAAKMNDAIREHRARPAVG